jgi:hypothetical protein
MGWEVEKLSRTLFLQKHSVGNKVKYAIHPFVRVTTDEGVTYLEPLPLNPIGLVDEYPFDKIEYLDGIPGIDRESSAGDLSLTVDNSRGVRRASNVV